MKYLALILAALMLAASVAGSAATTRVSLASDGTQGDDQSHSASLSADGRFVAFGSMASNFVPGDTRGISKIFVRDRQTGQTTRVSVARDGGQALSQGCFYPSISADGRYIAFRSGDSNLVLGDTNDTHDIFVHDRQTGVTSLVSVASDGTQANRYSDRPSISADGRYVAFESGATNLVPYNYALVVMQIEDSEIFVHDRLEGTTTRISVGIGVARPLGPSCDPSISADGRYVAFESFASNLVAGDTNGAEDIFVYDRQTGVTSRASVASNGAQATGPSSQASISADGRYIAFTSSAADLVSNDTNAPEDVFVHDRVTGQTARVSVASDETQAAGNSMAPSISADGRYVAFESSANNLVAGDVGYTDVFLRDRQAGTTKRISVASDATPPNGDSSGSSISADGQYIAFTSLSSTFVPDDTNSTFDIFLSDRGPANGSLSPVGGYFVVGSKYTFTSRYSDPDGYANLANCYLLINKTLNQANAAFLRYDANANKLYVRNDANTAWLGGYAPGAANVIENSYARLYCAETSRSMSGDVVVVSWRISFKEAMSPRTCGAWMLVYDDQGFKDSFEQKGAGIRIGQVPSNSSLSPTSGTYATETKLTFTSRHSDPDGYGNLENCYLLINTDLDQMNAAFVRYDVNANKLYVKDDTNTQWMGGISPGEPGTIENTYVRLYPAETTRSGSGTTLTINWKIAFKAGMSGKTCRAYLLAYDDQGFKAGWNQKGSGIKIGQTPSNVSLSPNTGTLSVLTEYTFTCTYSDPDEYDNLANCYLLINSTLSQANAIFVRYDVNTGLLYLKNSENTEWTGGVTPGKLYNLGNTLGQLACGSTSVVPSGDTLTINWGIFLHPEMAGWTPKAWMLVYDDLGLRDGYDEMGAFTVVAR